MKNSMLGVSYWDLPHIKYQNSFQVDAFFHVKVLISHMTANIMGE